MRDEQIEAARRSVNGADLARFNEALASNQAANFAWWNEEHNYLIDRRAAIPVRRATLELGARLAADGRIERPEDMFFLFKEELYGLMEGGVTAAGATWKDLAAMIPDRRAYFEDWKRRGPELPTMLGTIPDTVPDPIMIEVFGLSGRFLEALRGGADRGGIAEIRGFPAAKGLSRDWRGSSPRWRTSTSSSLATSWSAAARPRSGHLSSASSRRACATPAAP